MVPLANITIKNVPDGIYRRLRDSAGENHRSINSEVIACLEKVLPGARVLGVESGPLAFSRTKLSFATIARRAELPISTVWRALTDKDRQPQISTISRIAATLDLSMDEFERRRRDGCYSHTPNRSPDQRADTAPSGAAA